MIDSRSIYRVTLYSIVSNVVLAAAKWTTGYFGNSFALIADAIESTSDILASVLVLVGLRYAARPADKDHPYGHGKAEPLVTFMIVAFLLASAGIIAYKSVRNILIPHELPKPFTLIVLAGIITWKEISFRIVRNRNRELKSTALEAEAMHHRSDAITSLAAFAGISIALIAGEGYEDADDWAALLASVVIAYHAYRIFRPALGEVMDEHLYDDLVEEIRKIALKVEGVSGTEKCFIRKSGMRYQVDLHATVRGEMSVKEGHEIAHRLKDLIMHQMPEISHILIHIEPDNF